MPVYNGGSYLAAAVESILNQTWKDFEFIIVDDGSTDGSLEVLKKYAQQDDRIRVISRANTGIVGALNDGLAAARAKYIARMDGDDISLPTRLGRQVAYLEENPSCVAVGASAELIDEEGDPLCVVPAWTDPRRLNDDLLRCGGSALIAASVVMRADAVRQVGGYRKEFEWTEHKDLFIRLAEIGQLANVPDVLYLYRQLRSSVCYTRQTDQRDNRQRLMADACRRRGIPLESIGAEWQAGSPRPMSELACIERWCLVSLNAGNRATARKHARRLLRRAPLAPRHWWLAVDSHFGLSRIGKTGRRVIRRISKLVPRTVGRDKIAPQYPPQTNA